MTRWEVTSRVRSAKRNWAKDGNCVSHGLITDTYDKVSFDRYCQRFVRYLPEGWKIGRGGYQGVIDRVLFKPRARNAYVMVVYDPTRMKPPTHN